jgi:RNA 2',3'-cyclic 3'-phosphodiesterase
MRLFIAIPLDDLLKEYFRTLQAELKARGARASFVKDFHLTLKFLGEVPESKLLHIMEALDAIRCPDAELIIDKIGYFPDPRKPRVVWVGAEPRDILHDLHVAIDDALLPLGFTKDARFHPHVTLCRVQGPLAGLCSETAPKRLDMSCFELIESTLTSLGPVYRTIKTFKSKP